MGCYANFFIVPQNSIIQPLWKTFEGNIVSDREKDILRLINQDMDSPEISETSFLSITIVHTHRKIC